MLRSRRTHALVALALLAPRCSCSGIARSRFRTPKTRCGSVLSGSHRESARSSTSTPSETPTRSETRTRPRGTLSCGCSTGAARSSRSGGCSLRPESSGPSSLPFRMRRTPRHATEPTDISRGDRRVQPAARPARQMGGDARSGRSPHRTDQPAARRPRHAAGGTGRHTAWVELDRGGFAPPDPPSPSLAGARGAMDHFVDARSCRGLRRRIPLSA